MVMKKIAPVRVKKDEDTVTCPVCGETMKIKEEKIPDPCPHLDDDVYITGPDMEGEYTVWFNSAIWEDD